jgi:NAD(P)-dependent dehydrogenase (short-subunit alcohol dehydrogenase family)
MDDLAGRIAVVTGGGEGIGRGIAHALAGAGARVAIVDIDGDAAERVARELEGSRAFVADVSKLDAMTALADEVERELGPVTVLCNNAGVMLDGSLVDAPLSDWQWVLGVNLLGVVHGVEAFVPRIRANGGGHVVNTGSMAGLAPRLGSSLGIYSASKAAVVSFSEMLRAELAPQGIGVSVLCPSTVETRIWEADRNRPSELGAGRAVPKPERAAGAIGGMDVGPLVVRGILENRAYIFTSDDVRPRIEQRNATVFADVAAHEADRAAIG